MGAKHTPGYRELLEICECLLEACETALIEMEEDAVRINNEWSVPTYEDYAAMKAAGYGNPTIEKMRAAIAKARGES